MCARLRPADVVRPRLPHWHHRPFTGAPGCRPAGPGAVSLVEPGPAGLCGSHGHPERSAPRRQNRAPRSDQLQHRRDPRNSGRGHPAGQHAGAVLPAGQPPRPRPGRAVPRAWSATAVLRHLGWRPAERCLAGPSRAHRASGQPITHQVQTDHRRFWRLGPVSGTAASLAGHRCAPWRGPG